jgi:hypothetical protein
LSDCREEKEGLLIVHEPEIIEKGDEIRVSSRIEVENSSVRFPETLWFRFPNYYRDYLTDRSDGFAVALLPVAMDLGEKLWIRGVVSPRLALGIAEYQRIQTSWHPDRFKMIEIDFGTLAGMEPSHVQDGVATAFSGGVDSFHTLRSHVLQEQIQKYRLSHCLMINGFDFNNDDIEDCTLFNQITRVYQPLLQELNAPLLVAHTNITPFFAASLRLWNIHGNSHGAILTAPALVLGRLLRCLFIPSGPPYSELVPWGSHPLLDHLLSTETMETRHDGAHLSRFEKEAALAQWPEVYTRLRVCNRRTKVHSKTGALTNCCHCEKCMRTMVGFELLGALNNFTVFPEGLTRAHLWGILIPSYLRIKWINLGREALKRGRLVLVVDIVAALLLSPLRKMKRRLLTALKRARWPAGANTTFRK